MSGSSVDESKLRELMERMNQFARPVNVPIEELFPDDFVRRHTDLPDSAAFLAAAGLSREGGNRQFETEQFAEAVRDHSAFPGPRPFVQEATASYLRRKLGFD